MFHYQLEINNFSKMFVARFKCECNRYLCTMLEMGLMRCVDTCICMEVFYL